MRRSISVIQRLGRFISCKSLVLALLWTARAAVAVSPLEGRLIEVTAERGEIRDGQRVTATVAKGTKLWAFQIKEDGSWAEVKEPGGERRGWLAQSQFRNVLFTEAQSERIAAGIKSLEQAAELLNQGQWQEARSLYEQALEESRRIRDPDDAIGAYLFAAMGDICVEQDDPEAAVPHYRTALPVYRRMLGSKSAATAELLRDLGNALYQTGEYQESRDLLTEAVAARTAKLGATDEAALAARWDLGEAEFACDDYEAAHATFDALVADFRALGDESALDLAKALHKRGWTAAQRGEFDQAQQDLEESLSLRRRQAGKRSVIVGDTLYDLGRIANDQEDYARAADCFRDAAANYRRDEDMDRLVVADALHEEAFAAKAAGEYERALRVFDDALALVKDSGGASHLDAAAILRDRGWAAYERDDNRSARESFTEAMLILRTNPEADPHELAGALMNCCRIELDYNNNKEAETLIRETIEILSANSEGWELNLAEAWQLLSRSLRVQKRLDEANQALDKALQLAQQAGDDGKDTLAVTYWDQSDVACDRFDYDRAMELLKQSLDIRNEVFGETSVEATDILIRMSEVANYDSDYVAAKDFAERAWTLRKESLGEDSVQTAIALQTLAGTVEILGDLGSARKMMGQALAVFEKQLGEVNWRSANAYTELGRIEQSSLNFNAARRYLQKSVAIHEQLGVRDDADAMLPLTNLGFGAMAQGDFAAARDYFQQVIDFARRVYGDDDPSTAGALVDLARVDWECRRYREARANVEQALKVYRAAFGKDEELVGDALSMLAIIEDQEGDYQAAEKCHEQSLAICKQIYGDEHPFTALCRLNYGDNLYRQGKFAQGRAEVQRALKTYLATRGEEYPETTMTLNTLARVAAAMDDFDSASEYCDRERHADRVQLAKILPTLTEREQLLYLETQHRECWADALSLGVLRADDRRIAALSAGWLVNGKAVAQEALAESALLTNSETAPLVERLRAVRSKLAKVAANPSAPNYRRDLATLESEQIDLVRRINAAGTGFSQADPWVSIATLRGELGRRSMMINIGRFRLCDFADSNSRPDDDRIADHYVAWIIPPSDEGPVEIVDLGTAEKIDELVLELRKGVDQAPLEISRHGEARAAAALDAKLAALGKLIWAPLAAKVKDAEELVLSPDGALWLAPWAALPIDDGKFLLEAYRVRFVVSGRELVQQRVARVGVTPPVVLANPNYDFVPGAPAAVEETPTNQLATRSTEQLQHVARLPGTAREARAIQGSLEKLSGTEPALYLDAAASESQFKELFRPRVLVLSTHGFFLANQTAKQPTSGASPAGRNKKGANPSPQLIAEGGAALENPLLRCGLLLAGCNKRSEAAFDGANDGVLTGLEIVGTDLRGTELVVLSACDTGVGEVRNGDGVAGLRQAFQLAGAESVLASLWQIPDAETVKLMTDYFVYLAQGASKSEALRGAQLNRIRDHRAKAGAAHPFYWAAFTLTGRD